MVAARQVKEDPIWENNLSPFEMGAVYEKCASFSEAALYYKSRFPEPWAQEGWIRVKTAHKNFYKKRRDFERVKRIEEEIIFHTTTKQSETTDN